MMMLDSLERRRLMKPAQRSPSFVSRTIVVAIFVVLSAGTAIAQTADPLPSWKPGAARQSIVDFVRATTDPASPQFVPVEERIATFDQDGTLWAEQPLPTQGIYCLDRVAAVVAAKPELKDVEPFKTVLSGDHVAIAKLSNADLEKIAIATITGMPTQKFQSEVQDWLATARHPRWKRKYTELTYQPMQELMKYLRANG